MNVETEKKYRLPTERRDEVVGALSELGADHIGEDLEENIIYGGESLAEKNAVLRIRKTQNRSLLTYKQRIEDASDIKRQIEEETEVQDAGSMMRIVENLGLTPHVIYEKRRETWRFRSVEIVIDELPYGLFMEIEGPINAIREAEMLLGIEDLETEHMTYPRLTAEFGNRNGSVIESRFE
jgi:adenylate cyclase class 2